MGQSNSLGQFLKSVDLSAKRGGGARFALSVAAFFGLAILANMFAAYYVAQERYVYFWDTSGYWLRYLDISQSLLVDPIGTILRVIGSVRNSNYNFIPVFPLAPFQWVLGPDRLGYILAVTNAFLLPSVLVLAALANRTFFPRPFGSSIYPLIVVTAVFLVLNSLWAPVLRGYPGVIGLSVIGVILLMYFAKPLADQRLGQLVMIGLLLCLLVLIRRWYAYWVVAFFPALAVAQSIDIHRRFGVDWQRYIATVRSAAIIGLTWVAAVFIVATPFAMKAMRTDYSDIYSAYRHSSSLLDAARLLPLYFGWGALICSVAGLVWLTVRQHTRVVGSFLMLQSCIIFVLFARTQDFMEHQYYLLVPNIALGIGATVLGIWEYINNRWWRSALIGLIFITLLAGSATVFYPRAAVVSRILSNFVPQIHFYPLVRNDLDILERLSERLDELVENEPGQIYVLASSEVLNDSILRTMCEFGAHPPHFCGHLVATNHVDKRDGFPQRFLSALYIIVAQPTQFHLGAEHQRVIGVLAREVLNDDGIGKSFRRLPGQFKMDSGVNAWVFKKVGPLERKDLDELTEEFSGYYPGRRQLFQIWDEHDGQSQRQD